METRRNTTSVIAKLMGLDETPPRQQPVSGQQRVLSENYLQKSGSIGKRSRKDTQNTFLGSKKRANPRTNYWNKDASLRFLEQSSFDGMHDMKSTIVFDSENNGKNDKSDKGVAKRFDLLKSLNLQSEFKDIASRLPTEIVVLKPNLANVQRASRPSFLLDSQTTFAWEAKKQLLERSKMTKVSQEVRSSSQSCSLGEMLFLANPKSKPRSELGSPIGISSKGGWKDESVTKLPTFKRLNFSSNLIKQSEKTTRNDVKSSYGEWVSNMSTNAEKNHLVSNSSSPCSLSSDADAGTKDVESSHGDAEDKQQSEPIGCNYSAKEGCSSSFSDLSSEQDSLIRSHEDGLISSNCVQIDEEHPNSPDQAYQRSPNSVLEPLFREDNSSSSEYCKSVSTDLHGLWMQLELLKSESEDNHFGPEMVTSSDDERSSYTSQNLKSTRCFGPKESRDFSYLVDVLGESGFQGVNLEISFERWHSPERMVSPSVFETFEKKYGKQESWYKAERRLLFDRINAGVMEILRPHVDIRVCPKPLRRKMRNMLRRDVIEEELSTLLLSQENEVRDGVSEKAVGRGPWLELVDELDSLVREIETFLFDELAAELVYV